MWFIKQICQICHKTLPKSELHGYITTNGNKILSCEKCSMYIKNKTKVKDKWYQNNMKEMDLTKIEYLVTRVFNNIHDMFYEMDA